MQESSENRELVKPTPTAYSVSFDLTSHQRADQNENSENLVTDHNSMFISSANIPDEIALLIFHYLDIKDLCTASGVNKKWLQLASDKRILNELIQLYKHGNLWKYLSKTPEIRSYQTYFQDVFGFQIEISTFFSESSFTLFKNNFILKNHEDFKKEIKVQEEFVEYVSELSHLTLLQQAVLDTKEILSILHAFKENDRLSLRQCSKIISLFMRIRKLEALITDYCYVSHYTANKRWWSPAWLDDPKKNQLLSSKGIVALVALMDHKIIYHILNNPNLGYLASSLSEQQIIQIADLAYQTAEKFIQDSRITSKISNKTIMLLTTKLDYQNVGKVFYNAIETNPSYYQQWNGDLLVELSKEHKFSLLILTHHKLLSLLAEEQFLAISLNLFPDEITKLLDNEAFWNFKVTNRRLFLLKFPFLKTVIAHPHAAAFFLPEDFFPLNGYGHLGIALALAKQNILLQKFSYEQLSELSSYHPEVTKILDKNLTPQWWSEYSHKKTEQNSAYHNKKIKADLQSSNLCSSEDKQKSNLNEKGMTNSLSHEIPIAKPTIIKDEKNPEDTVRNPLFHILFPFSKQNNISNIKLDILITLTLYTAILTTTFFAIGIGGLLGVGFIVAALTLSDQFKNKTKHSPTLRFNSESYDSNNSSSYQDFYQKEFIRHSQSFSENLSESDEIISEVYPPLFVSSQKTTTLQNEKINPSIHSSSKTMSSENRTF